MKWRKISKSTFTIWRSKKHSPCTVGISFNLEQISSHDENSLCVAADCYFTDHSDDGYQEKEQKLTPECDKSTARVSALSLHIPNNLEKRITQQDCLTGAGSRRVQQQQHHHAQPSDLLISPGHTVQLRLPEAILIPEPKPYEQHHYAPTGPLPS